MPETETVRAFLEPRHLELAREAGAFAERELAPLPQPLDDGAARVEARRLLALLGAAGWVRHAVAEADGGAPAGPDSRACCLVREALAAASPLADAVFALQCLGSLPISLAGDPDQRRRYLPGVATGELMAAFAMTEPEAGSDVGAIATVAERDGSGYRISGRKWLISNAGIADFYVAFASTDRAAGRRGLSCFVVEAGTAGLRFAGPQVLSAPHPLGELAFEDCRVPATARLGAEGEGLKLGLRTLDRLRATVAAAACGMAARALEEALAHARRRRQFGSRLGDFQLVQAKLAVMATELAAARLLTYRAAALADRGADRVTTESAMAKAFATEAAQRIVDGALQVLGGRGVLADHPVERLYRAVRALRIYEGTTEIQHLVIARALLD
ncbi:MAG TPA: acyl-CoA dehydrogenase family protein [Thermoanaerobaculia bacterium]|nr:acyl-CoA dehydrogenase family protein [Thermoanaerobaculia bacterium]